MKRIAWISIIFITFLGLSHATPVFAQTPPPRTTTQTSTTQTTGFTVMPSAEEMGTIIDQRSQAGQTSKETYTVNSQALLANGVTCMITGCSANPQSAFYYGKSTVASINNSIVAMYTNPPANFALWMQDTGQSLGFMPKKAYAQGIGFTGVSAILPIWKAFRNISYALLAVIMVIIGFMVMFRQKIDPKTVVTVQNSLPKVVLALLLVSFSYPIAGFLIDLMYLTMSVVINLIVANSGGILGSDTASKYINGGLGTIITTLFGGGMSSVNDLVKLLFYSVDQNNHPIWWLFQQAQAVTIIPWLSENVLIGLIVAIAILFGVVRIAFMLVSAYIQIIVAILIAPFQLMLEALPGSTSFSSWLKNMIANLSVFPITAAMILVGTLLTQSNSGRIWTPPFLTGGSAQGGVAGLIGLGVLMTIPNVANGIKEALKAKAPVEAGLGAVLGPMGSGVGQAFQLWYQGTFIASPFLHKTPQSTPLERSQKAQMDGFPKPGGSGHTGA